MRANYLDYSDTNCFSSSLIRYIENDPQLNPFISYPPTFQGFIEILDSKKVLANREVLANVIAKQYEHITDGRPNKGSLVSDKVSSNIQLLKQANTFTITTGHQLNIFTGPLYFIFKIVTAIKLASDLKSEFPDKNFVPVYWMATEDHDFEEINHTYVSGHKIQWSEPAQGATGRISPESLLSCLHGITGLLGGSDNALQLSRLITTAYTQNTTLSQATRYLVNALFSEFGLVIIDADHKELKDQFKTFIADDIIHQHSFKNISKTDTQLQAVGVDTLVNPREINFFYLLDNFRERIVFEEQKYKVLNSEIHFTEAELKKEIDLHPERFSPNVVMRPLYQEVILPNLAYVGGGAEIIYWLQLKQNFDCYGVDFPILIPRNSALIVDEKLEKKLARLDLKIIDIFKKTEILQKEWVVAHSAHTLHLKKEWNELESIFTILHHKAEKIDSTLGPSTEAVKARLYKALTNLEKKLLKAEKKNHEEAIGLITNIRMKLFPNGGLQERTENFAPFYVKNGKGFITDLIKLFEPLHFKFSVIEEGCD